MAEPQYEKNVTFDTSWLERTGYDFSFAAFRCIQYTEYQVILSEVIDKEITKHLIEKANNFVDSYNSLLKKNKIYYRNVVKIKTGCYARENRNSFLRCEKTSCYNQKG